MENKGKIIGNGQYTVGENQQFVDQRGNLVRVTRGNPKPVPIGEAYAFFDCKASKEDIEKEIPTIRDLIKTPNELELSLMEGTTSLNGDTELGQIADKAREAEIKYVMKANYPTSTNHQTADELAGILNQAYQSPLYQNGEQFRGEIVYKENGEYVFR